MALTDGLMIVAVVVAPLMAVQVQKYLERYREDRGRRLNVFKTLMATRATPASPDHVQALNMIDLEFQGSKYKSVTDAWKTYLDHLSHPPGEGENLQPGWDAERIGYLSRLLIEMGGTLGYDFDEVHIKRASYLPGAQARVENENMLLRNGLIRLLHGDTSLKMDIESLPVTEDDLLAQRALTQGLQDLVDGKRNLGVEVSKSTDQQ